MDNNINDIIQKWKKDAPKASTDDLVTIIIKANGVSKTNRKIQFTNIIILGITFIGLILFFVFVAPMRESLSRTGIALMLGGLFVRILIELYSIYLSFEVNISEAALTKNKKAMRYHKFRRTIHREVTASILVLYTIGFYMLLPEFKLYIHQPYFTFMHISYWVGAIIVGFFIRKGTLDEIKTLDTLIGIEKDLLKE